MRAFTLIELLVVVTIIVILLALLAPALDKAVYQAELAVCGTQLSAISTGGSTYAVGNRRYYPDTGLGLGSNPQQAFIGTGDGSAATDRRKVLRAALGELNKPLNDPLTNGKLDFERSTAQEIYSNYNLWFGWTYAGHEGMKRIGDRFTWIERSLSNTDRTLRSSNIVASDRDEIARPNEAQSSHPDADGVLFLLRRQDEANPWGLNPTASGLIGQTITQAIWWSNNNPSRGLTDSNFGAADGSVLRVNQIHWNEDERLARAPIYPYLDGGGTNNYYPSYFHYLPK